MRIFLLFFIILFLKHSSYSQIIVSQSFESSVDDTWNYTANPSLGSFTNPDYTWDVVSNLENLNTMPTNASNFLGAGDVENEENTVGEGDEVFLTFESVDISAYSNVVLSFDYEVENYDNGDDIFYTLYYDGDAQDEVNLVNGSANLSVSGTKGVNIPEGIDEVGIEIRINQNGLDYAGLDNFQLKTVNCTADLTPGGSTCESVSPDQDTYTATFDFSMGMESDDFTVTTNVGILNVNTISETGQIIVEGIAEGENVTIEVENADDCFLTATIQSPVCDPLSTSQVLITEVADPDNDPDNPDDSSNEKFVEICNRGTTTIDVSGWQLRRYQNGTTSSSNATIPAMTELPPNECFVFYYSISLTLDNLSCNSLSTSTASGNGDDAYQLYTGSAIVDQYGVVGVDGTGEDWEYANSIVMRNESVTTGNPNFDLAEWTIYENQYVSNATPCNNTSVLPVELISFDAELVGQFVRLNWATASETNNSHFNILRSHDGTLFETIGKVEGAGTTIIEEMYSFTDQKPNPGKNFYQLEQVDFDGSATKSDIISIEVEKDEQEIIYANSNESHVNLTSDIPTKLIVYTPSGLLIETVVLKPEKGLQIVQFNNSLKPGIYLFYLLQEDKKVMKKLLIR